MRAPVQTRREAENGTRAELDRRIHEDDCCGSGQATPEEERPFIHRRTIRGIIATGGERARRTWMMDTSSALVMCAEE